MTEKEFKEIYGRPPVRKTVKKEKIYWNRIIITLLIFVGIICGIVQAVKGISAKAESKHKEESSSVAESVAAVEETSSKNEDSKYQNIQMTVCVDAGHGDFDSGTANADGTRLEKDDNLAVSLLVEKYLKSYGVNVIMTRNNDTFLDLDERCEIANNQKADLLVCLHRNSYEGVIQGVEIWVHNSEPKEDTALAENIMLELEKAGISENRGVQYGYVGNPYINYYINADTVMPSCLVELGFLTDEEDNRLFDQNIDKYAEAIADGVVETGIQLGVIDKDGNRLIEGQLISEEKPINRSDESDMSDSGQDSYYTDESMDVYNQQENEYEM